MLMDAITGKLILKKGRQKPVLNRHPWIFSGAISRVEGGPDPGDLVAVCDNQGHHLAVGYFNPASQIRVRLLSWDPEPNVDSSFWHSRLQKALNGRSLLFSNRKTDAYRLINAEADGLPGFVVDRYRDFLVIQCLTLGIDRRKEMLTELLAKSIQPSGIYERSDSAIRHKEGLSSIKGLLWGESPPDELIVSENGLQFIVDVDQGHKTGFYLDQRRNRALIRQPSYVAGKSLLNVFAYTGGFSVYAASAEAGPIINVDSSIPALELAEKNMAINGFERSADQYIAGDAFEVLRHFRDQGQKHNVVILDPPKFAHGKGDITRASHGYKDLNLLALQLIQSGGLLMTFSCSGLISEDLFQKILFGATVDAGREVQIIQRLGQSDDHPVLLTFPESSYLKGFLCRVW